MSLKIDVSNVMSVLLADGWHDVKQRSFHLDAYEFFIGDVPVLLGGTVKGVSSTGAAWNETDTVEIYCPLTAILALAIRARPSYLEPDEETPKAG